MSEIEYYYSANSAYAYLGSRRFMEIADAAGRTIAHKPFDLRASLNAVGSQPFNERTEKHMEYFFVRELERWSEYRSAPVLKQYPTHHDNALTPSNTMLIAGLVKGLNIDRLAHAMMEQHWAHDCDLADNKTLATIARSVDIDPVSLVAISDSKEVRQIYAANTQKAIEMSVFGSPTYVVDGDMFYGQDHLEMVERALVRPFIQRIPS